MKSIRRYEMRLYRLKKEHFNGGDVKSLREYVSDIDGVQSAINVLYNTSFKEAHDYPSY